MKHNNKVFITLDRPRELWFGHKAQKCMQAMFALNPEELDTRHMNPEVTERVMYAMLLRDAEAHGEQLKLEDMEALLDHARPGKIIRKINEALVAAFAADDEDIENGWGDDSDDESDPEDPTGAET